MDTEDIQNDEICQQILTDLEELGVLDEINSYIELTEEELTSEEGKQDVPYLVIETTSEDEQLADILYEMLQEKYPLNNNHQPYLSLFDVEQDGIYGDEQKITMKFPLKEKYYSGITYNPELIEDVDDEP